MLRESSRPGVRAQLAKLVPYVILTAVSLTWIVPFGVAVVTAFRSMDDLIANGLIAFPHRLVAGNFATAWTVGGLGQDFINSILITVPSVLGTLLLASMAAFAIAQRKIPGSRYLLIVLMGGSMMPPQMLAIPIYELANQLQIYDTYVPLILVHIAFQLGFTTFVLHNYFRTIPPELAEAAQVDGAGLLTIYWSLILPLARPALAAMGALLTTWIFNDYFWAIVLISTNSKVPVTVGIVNLQGQFNVNWSIEAAGAVIATIPTLVIYLSLQRYFEKGLTAGVS